MTSLTNNAGGLVLVGAGKMGGALLQGWLDGGFPPQNVTIVDPGLGPANSAEFEARGIKVVADILQCARPKYLVLAIKPQIVEIASPELARFAEKHDLSETIIISIVAGVTADTLSDIFGSDASVVRAMPNTPALVGAGLTGIYFSGTFSDEMQTAVTELLDPVGVTLVLQSEQEIDAITAVSGSGPAYVFHMVEALTEAAREVGLSDATAAASAKQTIVGAARLLEQSNTPPDELRRNVTSPNGTTQAGLMVLMDAGSGLAQIMTRTVKAAFQRAIELGREQSK